MSKPKEIQQLEAGLSESGKKQLEEIKAAVGLYGDRDPALSTFVALQSIFDRFAQFGPKFAEVVRQSAHEARADAVKAGDLTMSQVVEKGMAKATQEMTANHNEAIREMADEQKAAIREMRAESLEIIRATSARKRRITPSLAIICVCLLTAAAGFSGWWYRDHQATQTAAWSQTFEGKQAAEFYQIIQNSVPDPAFLHSRNALQEIRPVLAWAVSQSGITAWHDWESEHKRKK